MPPAQVREYVLKEADLYRKLVATFGN